MSFAHYSRRLTGQIFSVPFWNKYCIYGQKQLAEARLKDFDSFQSHLSLSISIFSGISTFVLMACFNIAVKTEEQLIWQLEVTSFRNKCICFCIIKESQYFMAVSPNFTLIYILFEGLLTH